MRLLAATMLIVLVTGPIFAQAPETADYRVRFQATWTASSHPIDYPANAHFSTLIGAVHNDEVHLWQQGQLASDGIEQMAEIGATSPLDLEIADLVAANDALAEVRGGGIGLPPGSTSANFTVSQDYPLVSLVSMIAPSPDWFVGVDSVTMFESGNWVEQKVILLYAYDAGTDSGATFRAPNQNTDPAEPISHLGTGAFANGVPLGTLTFSRRNAPSSTPLVLTGGRFAIDIEWQNSAGTRVRGNPQMLTDDTGYFWFFDADNVEMVIKVLDGCALNQHFWVFAGGLTDVEVDITVTDTQTGAVQLYSNPLGAPFQPIQDTFAFECL